MSLEEPFIFDYQFGCRVFMDAIMQCNGWRWEMGIVRCEVLFVKRFVIFLCENSEEVDTISTFTYSYVEEF